MPLVLLTEPPNVPLHAGFIWDTIQTGSVCRQSPKNAVFAIACATMAGLPMAFAQTVPPEGAPERVLLAKYCVTCHNDRAKTGGLTLEKIDTANAPANAEVWERVIRKLRVGAMPPAGMPKPSPSDVGAFLASLETSLDRAYAANPNPGHATLHRLNRSEYSNSIRDLLALDVDASSLLPPDDESYGFDNNADVLGVSPVLLERYVSASRKVSRNGGWRPGNGSGGANLSHAAGSFAGQARGGAAAWNTRRTADSLQLPVGWEVHHQSGSGAQYGGCDPRAGGSPSG